MSTVQITFWSIVSHPDDAYIAPERRPRHLQGQVRNYPGVRDGHTIRSSTIASSQGRVATTESGRIYELVGAPDPGYLAHLDEQGLAYDDNEPLRPAAKKGRAT